jgi:hypothetical protein
MHTLQQQQEAPLVIIITEAEMVCYFTELSPSAQAQVHSMTGGVYQLLMPKLHE